MVEEASQPVSYYAALSPADLSLEIVRETELLFGLADQLSEAVERRNGIREAIEKERTIEEVRTLQRDREKRIGRLRGQITELKTRIADERRTIAITRRRIDNLEARLPVPATRSNYFRLMRRIREFHRILRRYPPPSIITKVYYHKRIQEHLSWMRNIRTLFVLKRRLGGYQSAISRWNATITSFQRSIAQYERWQRVRVETFERLKRLREQLQPWINEIIRLRELITLVEAELEKKKRAAPPPKLCRIKIRLYNTERRKPTPTGMFQGFFDIDALIDPETELVDWDWHLTKQEIQICKYHMVGYFKGMATWRSPDQVDLAYFDEAEGIPYEAEKVKYKYSKRVPADFIAKAETLTVRELIVGISSVEPRPVTEPEGVFVQRFMIISAEGAIRWDEIRNKWAWKPTKTQIEEVREELGIA